MSFQVHPGAIRTYAAEFVDHAEDTHAMHGYIAEHSSFGWHEQGLINLLQPAHERFAGEVTRALVHLQDLLNRCRAELEDVAGFYERTDRAAAGRLDATYEQTPRPSRHG